MRYPDIWLTWAIIAALITLLLVNIAYAQQFAGSQRVELFEDPAPGDGWFARIVIYNGDMSGVNRHVLETSKGSVIVGYISSPNDCGAERIRDLACADDWFLKDWPDGVIASEWEGTVREYDEQVIYLYVDMGIN
jgi:hypothetical protein